MRIPQLRLKMTTEQSFTVNEYYHTNATDPKGEYLLAIQPSTTNNEIVVDFINQQLGQKIQEEIVKFNSVGVQ